MQGKEKRKWAILTESPTEGDNVKKFNFKKFDAFAAGDATGNPAAAVYVNSFDDITEQEMLRVARELKGFVCEVGYIAETGQNRYKLRYFSSEKEVEFCGHATIAIMYELLKNAGGRPHRQNVSIETNKGVLDVENRLAGEDSVFITAPVPAYSERSVETDEICSALAIRGEAINHGAPTGIVNAGNETLCVPIRGLKDLVIISPDYETLRAFCKKHDLDVINIFTTEVSGKAGAYRTRVFAAPFGYLEDPATGSGNAALGYHLLKHGLWSGERIVLEQNNDIANPNIIKMAAKADAGGVLRVIFGGSAVTRIDGYYLI
jgi:PhzF family phenazine biosynthesis protein